MVMKTAFTQRDQNQTPRSLHSKLFQQVVSISSMHECDLESCHNGNVLCLIVVKFFMVAVVFLKNLVGSLAHTSKRDIINLYTL